jgi:hypothetical protein
MEIRRPGDDIWTVLPPEPGVCSFSSEHEDGTREVYLFGRFGDQVGVWRSTAGVDVADNDTRVILSDRLELLSNLDEPYEMIVERAMGTIQVRLVKDPASDLGGEP